MFYIDETLRKGSSRVSCYLWWWARALMDWSLMECCGSSTPSWQQPSSRLFYSFHTATHRTVSARNTTTENNMSSGPLEIISCYWMENWEFSLPLRYVFRLPRGSWSKHRRSTGTWCTETLSGSEDAVETNPTHQNNTTHTTGPFSHIKSSSFSAVIQTWMILKEYSADLTLNSYNIIVQCLKTVIKCDPAEPEMSSFFYSKHYCMES